MSTVVLKTTEEKPPVLKQGFLKTLSSSQFRTVQMPCDVAVLNLDVYNSGQTSHLLSLDVNSKLGPVMLASLLINILAVSRRALEKTWGINSSLLKIIFLK